MWAATTSAIAWVSADEPDLQQNILSVTGVSLSANLFEQKFPIEVRESAPITTPPSNSAAKIVVYKRKKYMFIWPTVLHYIFRVSNYNIPPLHSRENKPQTGNTFYSISLLKQPIPIYCSNGGTNLLEKFGTSEIENN